MHTKPIRTMHMGFPSELGFEKLARHALAWLGPRLGLAGARVADLQTAVSEACINAIEHGNDGRPACRVSVTFSYSSEHLDAVIRDEGVRPYLAPTFPPASIEQKIAGVAAPRGMGLSLITQLVDEAEFLPAEPGGGNDCRLRMYLRPPERSPLTC